MADLPPFTTQDVNAAIDQVRSFGIPKNRRSTKFCLVAGNDHLPPKYVLTLAAKRSLGRELEASEFYGGSQTNQLLQDLGFEVRACGCGGGVASQVTSKPAPRHKKTASKPAITTKREKKAGSDTQARQPGLLSGLKRAMSKLLKPEPAPSPKTAKPGPAANTTIVRIVVDGQPPGDQKSAERMLLAAFKKWPKGVKTKFAITPGGFVTGRWPERTTIPLGWDSRGRDLARLTREAELWLEDVATPRVFDAAEGRTDVLTIGIDLDGGPNGAHAELVAVYDVSARQFVRWTGKSYPTGDQEHTLYHLTDLDSHLIKLAGERVLVLGCHDLMMYDPRGQANTTQGSQKHQRSHTMHALVTRFKPTVVLQHPHSTYSPAIWRNAWAKLRRDTPTVRTWGSGIAHYSGRADKKPRPLGKVLAATKSDDVRDIVLEARR